MTQNCIIRGHFCHFWVLFPPIFWGGARKGIFRGRELNPNIFFSNFSGASGISRQNPGISRQRSLIPWVSRDVPNFSAPTPSRGRPPPHQKISGLKSLGLGSFFVPEFCNFPYLSGFSMLGGSLACQGQAGSLMLHRFCSATGPPRGHMRHANPATNSLKTTWLIQSTSKDIFNEKLKGNN